MEGNTDKIEISIVSPVYYGASTIPELVRRIRATFDNMNVVYEVILVDDRSPDDSWEVIKRLSVENKNVKGIRFSKNFGQHYAITAGLEKARGKWIFLMDCDLQDDPQHCPVLLQAAKENKSDIVFTKRKKRKHSLWKDITARVYNSLFFLFSDSKYDLGYGSLVLFNEKVRKNFMRMKEKDRLYEQLLKWLGFNQYVVEVEHNERFAGKSTYSLRKMLKLAIQGWTSFSSKLLYISVYFGFALATLSFLAGLYIIYLHFTRSDVQEGWPSIIVTILFSTGVILISIGIAGVYIGKIFDETKNRPIYIIDEETDKQDDLIIR